MSVTSQQRAVFNSHTLYLDCLRKYQIVVSSYAAFEERDLRDKQIWTVSTGEGSQRRAYDITYREKKSDSNSISLYFNPRNSEF